MIDFSKYEAVGFDLDGTLVDSRLAFANAFAQVLRKWGVEEHPVDKLCSYVGLHLDDLLEKVGLCKSSKVMFIEEIEKIYPSFASKHLKPFSGVIETLEGISALGLKMALVTSNSLLGAKMSLEMCGIKEEFFDSIVTSCNTDNHKPHPEPIEKALSECLVEKEKFLFFGDSSADYGAAKAAGVDFKLMTHNSLGGVDATICSSYHLKSFRAIKNLLS